MTGSLVYAGETWYMLGQDSTGKWAEIFITDSVDVWVPKAVLALGKTALPYNAPIAFDSSINAHISIIQHQRM